MGHERRFFVDLQLPESIKLSLSRPAEGRQGEGQYVLPVIFSTADIHHLKNVLRLKVGDPVIVVNRGSGDAFLTTFIRIGDESTAFLQIDSLLPASANLPPPISIYHALCKSDANEVAIEKLCEVGVKEIVIWQSERSVARLGGTSEIEKKLTRYRRIAEASCKQSGQYFVPQIEILISLKSALQRFAERKTAGELLCVCDLGETARELWELTSPPVGLHFLVGPEGDFSDHERKSLSEALPITLGKSRLKSETAAIAAAVLSAAYFRKNSPLLPSDLPS